ncbi:MAG: hypothetical protein OEV64_04120 [Desulfobulbaceae bacterium]|nr:hypothetical protein [Desulfobulbaceae bacterium]
MDIEADKLIYQENTKILISVWDQRHRVMTWFFVTISALIAMTGFCYKIPQLSSWSFVPLGIAAVISYICHLLDKVNTLVTRACYKVGTDFEKETSDGTGIFTKMHHVHYELGNYVIPLKLLYLASAILFFVMSIIFCCIAIINKL